MILRVFRGFEVVFLDARHPEPPGRGAWGPSFIHVKLKLILKRVLNINEKILKNLLIYTGSSRPPAGELGMTGGICKTIFKD
jgi:hypothetical protein